RQALGLVERAMLAMLGSVLHGSLHATALASANYGHGILQVAAPGPPCSKQDEEPKHLLVLVFLGPPDPVRIGGLARDATRNAKKVIPSASDARPKPRLTLPMSFPDRPLTA